MEQKDILELITRFENSTLSKIEVTRGESSVKLEKPTEITNVFNAQAPVAPKTVTVQQEETKYVQVKSPIVGVFYQAPSPGEAPFAIVGQKVSKGQTLCLVEAMKMMNELKSPVDGIVKTVKGINEQLVEYDQVLFEVEPC